LHATPQSLLTGGSRVGEGAIDLPQKCWSQGGFEGMACCMPTQACNCGAPGCRPIRRHRQPTRRTHVRGRNDPSTNAIGGADCPKPRVPAQHERQTRLRTARRTRAAQLRHWLSQACFLAHRSKVRRGAMTRPS
jgi:hypothetical protein